jgi:vitamin B12 transporter
MYFTREIDNLIVFTFSEGFINRDRQNDNGFELSGNWIANHAIQVGTYYNYVSGEITTFDASGQRVQRDNLIRRPTHSIGVNMGINVTDKFLVRIDGEFNGERTDLFFNPENNFASEEVILDSYTLVNLYAEYKLLNSQFTLFSEIRNLFDTDFTEIYGFNTAGISVKGGLRFTF